jgi:hypothetical protein
VGGEEEERREDGHGEGDEDRDGESKGEGEAAAGVLDGSSGLVSSPGVAGRGEKGDMACCGKGEGGGRGGRWKDRLVNPMW